MHKSWSVVLAMMLFSGVGIASATPASSVVPSWSIVPSASPGTGPPNGKFISVACASPSSCFAVGNSASGLLMEQWDGAHWSIVATPGGALSDIACPSATSCVAVGGSGSPLIESWDGSSWAIAASPAVAGYSVLSSVACTSAASCVAVGVVAGQTLVERWNGTAWSLVPSPHPSKAASSEFVGVACATATNCFAVGSSNNGTTSGPLIEHWNGAAWSIVPGPVPTSTTRPNLVSVACPSTTSCFAVGSVQIFSDRSSMTTTLVDRWDGTKWSIVASPTVSDAIGDSLSDVSCSTTTDCFAVGSFVPPLPSSPPVFSRNLVERWNGTSWSVVASPNPDPSSDENGLTGVACPSSTSCFAVGTNASVTSPGPIEHWNGTTWSIVIHPMPFGLGHSALGDVACVGATGTCFAVGGYETATGTSETLIEQPTATGWTVMASPNPSGATASGLGGLSCPSTTLCFAVGASTIKSVGKTLVERWNGTAWSIVVSPNRPSGSSGLSSISCTNATNCMAVGNFNGGQTLTERWDGSTWTIVPSPNYTLQPPFVSRTDFLSSVACTSANSCFAVGSDEQIPGGNGLGSKGSTLIERWDGSTWTIVPSPNPGQLNGLSSVSCPNANSCYAVGFSYPMAFATGYSLIAHWNGTTWAHVASANPPSVHATNLVGVSCSTPTSCVAVGSDAPNHWSTLIETLAGTHWSIVSNPNPAGAVNSYLSAVSCASTPSCYAVGTSTNDFQNKTGQTLVEQYS
ncbi:MAG: hypothetical protein ACLPVY_22820 [Acidimicrobiia bacterium]